VGYKTYSCPHSKNCGGCEWLAVPYPIQLKRKYEDLSELYRHAVSKHVLKRFRVWGMNGMSHDAHGPHLDEYARYGVCTQIGGAPARYRCKAATPYAPGKGGSIKSGFYARNSHTIVRCSECLAEVPRARETLELVTRAAEKLKLRAYDEDKGRGMLRYGVVRAAWHTDQTMLTLVTNGDTIPKLDELLGILGEKAPWLTTVCQNVNTRKTNAILGAKTVTVEGPGYIEDALLGTRFEIGPASFYQTNPCATELLYRRAIDAAGVEGGMRLLDAYCGIGTIGLCAAHQVEGLEIISVERVAEAVGFARKNARLNGMEDRAEFVCADSTEWMKRAAADGRGVDAIVMDPPRAGSTPEFIAGACGMKPERIVYVSCNPQTQVRDLKEFERHGWYATNLCAVDMFAHTKHAESVAVLERKKNS
jgi:23S rRNA (uracil-5-)-methyltransferase RumA